MTKNLYQVVDDLFSRLPLYAVQREHIYELNEKNITGVSGGSVIIEGWRIINIDTLVETKEKAENELQKSIDKHKKERLKEVKERINALLEEVKELLK